MNLNTDEFKIDAFDIDFINPGKKQGYPNYPIHPNPSYTSESLLNTSLLIKILDAGFQTEIELYPPHNCVPHISVTHNPKLFVWGEKKRQILKFNSFQTGIYSYLMKIHYDGNLSDFQNFRHHVYDIFTDDGQPLRKFRYNTLVITDMIKNKNEDCFVAGKIWGSDFFKRGMDRINE